MAKTLNLIIVDDLALVKPLTERLGFKEAPWCLTDPVWGSQEGITTTLLRETRHTEEKISDHLLFFFIVGTDTIHTARGIGGYHHIGLAFKAAGFPTNLDVEFDRIMLATKFERFVVKERLSQMEGWYTRQNESRKVPLPEGGWVMVNDEDPNMDPRFKFPQTKRPVIKLLFMDSEARLDEWAERLNLGKCVEWTEFSNRNAIEGESVIEAGRDRNVNSLKVFEDVKEDTTFYIVVAPELLTASMFDQMASFAVMREKHISTSMMFLPSYQAIISEGYFHCLRSKIGTTDEYKAIPASEDQLALRKRARLYCQANHIDLSPMVNGISMRGLNRTEFQNDWLLEKLTPEAEFSRRHLEAQMFGKFEPEVRPDPFGIQRDKQQPSDCLTPAQKFNAMTLIVHYMQRISAVDAFKLGTEITTGPGSDEHTFTVNVTTRDPSLIAKLREHGLGPEEVKPNPLGRGLTDEAAQKLFREQNPHMLEELSPGWPDPLNSPMALAIRDGHYDDTEFRALFDRMEQELKLHREGAVARLSENNEESK